MDRWLVTPAAGGRSDVFLTLVASHVHIWVGLEMLGKQVSKGVILFLQDEIRGVGHAFVRS